MIISSRNTPPPGALAALDSQVFDELAALGDTLDDGFLVALIDQFFGETKPMLVGLREAMWQGDALSIGSIAHSLKGSSAQLGGLRLAFGCDRLECLARRATSPDLSGLQTSLLEVERDYQALCVLLSQRVSAERSEFTP